MFKKTLRTRLVQRSQRFLKESVIKQGSLARQGCRICYDLVNDALPGNSLELGPVNVLRRWVLTSYVVGYWYDSRCGSGQGGSVAVPNKVPYRRLSTLTVGVGRDHHPVFSNGPMATPAFFFPRSGPRPCISCQLGVTTRPTAKLAPAWNRNAGNKAATVPCGKTRSFAPAGNARHNTGDLAKVTGSLTQAQPARHCATNISTLSGIRLLKPPSQLGSLG